MLNKLLHAMTITLLLSLFVGNGSLMGQRAASTPELPSLHYAQNSNSYSLISTGHDLN